MKLGNQQERLEADLNWFAGIFDGEGCIALVATNAGRNYPTINAQIRFVTSSDVVLEEIKRIFAYCEIPCHIAKAGPSHIGTKHTWRVSINGAKRCRRFLSWFRDLLRCKREEARIVDLFLYKRLMRGPRAPYSDEEIELFIKAREAHGYRLRESSETIRKRLLETRYRPNSDRKTEREAEMTSPTTLIEAKDVYWGTIFHMMEF